MSNPNVTIDRHKYIGGSDLPTILGLNAKYGKNIYDFAREKAGIIPNTFKGNQFTKYGQLMEPIIRDYINSIYGVNFREDTIVDTERGYRGNTDGIDTVGILEVKTFGEELDVDYYTPQCQFYMEVFNKDKCLLVGYKRPADFYTGVDYNLENDDSYFNLEFNENNIVTHTIYRDPSLWLKIDERIKAFQKAVEMLRENHNITEGEFNIVFYGADLIEMSNKMAMLENSLIGYKEIEKQHKEVKDKLYKLFEERNIVSFETNNMKITKVAPISYDTVSIDTAQLKLDLPDIYEQYKTIKRTNKKGYVLVTIKKENK